MVQESKVLLSSLEETVSVSRSTLLHHQCLNLSIYLLLSHYVLVAAFFSVRLLLLFLLLWYYCPQLLFVVCFSCVFLSASSWSESSWVHCNLSSRSTHKFAIEHKFSHLQNIQTCSPVVEKTCGQLGHNTHFHSKFRFEVSTFRQTVLWFEYPHKIVHLFHCLFISRIICCSFFDI